MIDLAKLRVESWRLRLRTRQPGRRALEIDGPTFLTFDPVFKKWTRRTRLWVIIGDPWGWGLMECQAPEFAAPGAVVRLIEERARIHAEHFAAIRRGSPRPGPLAALPSPPEPPMHGPWPEVSV